MSQQPVPVQLVASERSKQLMGPFTHHVYLGCSYNDAVILDKLRRRLENMDLACYSRIEPDKPQTAFQSLIKEGTSCSRKCLIYLTDDYIDELESNWDPENIQDAKWSGFELKRVLEKVSRISRDVLMILKSKDLTKSIPEELREFTMMEATEEMIEHDMDFLKHVLLNILKEPNASLVTMPKQNIGYGSALGYFYGFLRLVLPDFRKRLLEETLARDEKMAQNTVKKMLIIMPESCFCPPKFPQEFMHTNKFVVRVANRAGNEKRDYKSSLYHVRDAQDGQDYYFVGELATPLLTMYESYADNLASLTLEELYAERDAFYVSLNAILSHRQNENCHQQYKLLFWRSDPESHREKKVALYDYLLPVIKEELRYEKDSETECGKQSEEASVSNQSQQVVRLETDSVGGSGILKETFQTIHVRGHNPAELYNTIEKYDLDVATDKKRGYCLIINIQTFEKGSVVFQPRSGAEKDVENVMDVFGRLHFICQLHEDLTLPNLENLLLTMSHLDHSAYKAFVCVFMTHGRLGELHTSDAKPVSIINIVEYFNDKNCPSLRGKPKMFFIQACQRGFGQNHTPSTTNGATIASSLGENSVGLVQVYQVDSGRSTGNNSVEPSVQPSDATDVKTLVDVQSRETDVADVVDETARKESAANNDTPSSVVFSAIVERAIEEDAAKACLDWDANVAPTLQAANERGLTWYTGRSRLIPGWPDFLMSYSTLPGAAAYRDVDAGSLYIQFLCAYLKQSMEIDEALKNVTRSVREFLESMSDARTVHRFQLPFHLTSGMEKRIIM